MGFMRWMICVVLLGHFTLSDLSKPKLLHDKHLRLFFSEFKPYFMVTRNSSGHVINASGGCLERLNWLSKSLGFTYSIEPLPVLKSFDKGNVHYVLNGDVDWLVGVILMTADRNQLFDFPYPWAFDYASLILPYPTESANTDAPFKPYTYPVWIFILTAAVLCCGSMYLLSRLHNSLGNRSRNEADHFTTIERLSDYIVAVILSQGGTCYSKRLVVRIVASVWCLAAFVLVNAYSSTLTSFVSAPNRQLLISSMGEVLQKQFVKVVMVKGKGTDVFISNSNANIDKHIKDMWTKDPSLRCPSVDSCLEMIRTGTKVYSEAYITAMNSVNRDYKEMGYCRYTIAKERMLYTPLSFAIPKRTNYIEELNKEVMFMWDTGLIERWDNKMAPKPKACLDIKQRPTNNVRLDLRNLSGAFAILTVGLCFSCVVFLCELMLRFLLNRMKNH